MWSGITYFYICQPKSIKIYLKDVFEVKTAEKEKLLKALGDANRMIIMDLISENELSAGQILRQVNMGQSTLSHHMKILCDSGIVNARKDSRWVYYTVNREVAEELSKEILAWVI